MGERLVAVRKPETPRVRFVRLHFFPAFRFSILRSIRSRRPSACERRTMRLSRTASFIILPGHPMELSKQRQPFFFARPTIGIFLQIPPMFIYHGYFTKIPSAQNGGVRTSTKSRSRASPASAQKRFRQTEKPNANRKDSIGRDDRARGALHGASTHRAVFEFPE